MPGEGSRQRRAPQRRWPFQSPWMRSPFSSMAMNLAIRLARVSGRLAS
ncbi:hypothetical protein U91I_03562 [alpha proteobacterium U9-1i]|nr:hypothetical protein U91I_03562 [alpha proteobacterium U9-1i]